MTLFSSKPSVHDSITNIEGSFDKTLKGLRNLINAGVDTCIYTVPMKNNLNDISGVVDLADNEGCKKLRILSLSPTGRALENYDDLKLNEDDVTYLNGILNNIDTSKTIEITAGFCTRISYPGLTTLKGHDSCYMGRNRVHVDAYGNVYPCTASSGQPSLKVGSIRNYDGSIKELWMSSPYLQLLRNFHSHKQGKCTNCIKYSDCMSGCRIILYYQYGDISILDPNCDGPKYF